MMRLSHVIMTAIWVGLVVMTGVAAGQEAKIKVHKERVEVTAADELGTVMVQGRAGAIDSTSEVKLVVERWVETPAELREDGSFLARVEAQAGNKIVVRARNKQGKTSRGTFRVPAGHEPSQYESPEGEPSRAKFRRLEMVIQVIDMDTGETVAQKRFKWTNKLDTVREAFKATRSVVNAGIRAAKKELDRTQKGRNAERKAKGIEARSPEPSKDDPNKPDGVKKKEDI